MRMHAGSILAACLVLVAAADADDVDQRLSAARLDLQHGRYAEARAAFDALRQAALSPRQKSAAVGGLAQTHLDRGEYDQARRVLEEHLRQQPDDADAWGRLAEVQFLTGAWDAARQSADQGLRRDTDALRARLVLAHLHRETGELDQALEGYRWFVRYYNRVQPRDAPTLRLTAEGSLEYARWKHVTGVFQFVVNTLCPDALKDDPTDWRTCVLSGNLLLEKYNQAQAVPEFQAALAINPQAAEAYSALARAALQERRTDDARTAADQALEINPQLVEALLARAEVELELDAPDAARPFIDRALQVNPRDQSALACRAVLLLSTAPLPSTEALRTAVKVDEGAAPRLTVSATAPGVDPQFLALAAELAARNPRPGPYLNRLGEFFEARRKFDQAEVCYRAAFAVMPQLAAAQTNLGLHYMRTGRIDEAEQTLAVAFKADPFHVRVSNMRKVIDLLKGYETIRTEHFVVRVDAADQRLGEAMAEYLEELHDELVPQFGYEPPAPTQFEVYSRAKGQSAHQWFSARMVGLPWIQTIGASTGRIVALMSPSATDKPFHWGRVLKHEYVHILTLQQSDFNIPHWYTEALAVRAEGLLLPPTWQRLLVERHAAGRLYTLQDVQQGFRRPESPDDWSLAYCQSRQYARFIEDHWGADALTGLLHAYGRGATDAAAIQEVLGLPIDEFETQHRVWLGELVQRIERCQISPRIDLDRAKADFLAQPNQAAPLGRYAWAVWQNGEHDEARSLAAEALRIDPQEPFAAVVAAELAEADGQVEEARQLLAEAFDPQRPSAVLLGRLAERLLTASELDAAAEAYRLGVREFPLEDQFWKGLATTYLQQQDHTRLGPILEVLADRDGENVSVRSKLAELALARRDFPALRRWAREVLFLEFDNAVAHAWLGIAAAGLREPHRARREFQLAIELDEACPEARLGLARLELQSGRTAAALEQVQAVLSAAADHAEALELFREIQARANR